MVASAENQFQIRTDSLLKSDANIQKLHWRICRRSYIQGAAMTFQALFETAGSKNFLLIIPTNIFRLNKKPDRFENDAQYFKTA